MESPQSSNQTLRPAAAAAALPPSFFDKRILTTQLHSDGRWLMGSALADPYGHWGMTRAAAMATAARCGVPIAPFQLHRQSQGLMVQAPSGSDPLTKTPMGVPGAARGFEEHGGLGLTACVEFIDAHSSAPIADVHALLRWVVVSYLLGHSEQHAGHIVLTNAGQGFRLAPFAWMTAFPAAASAARYPLAKGMKIGSAWPDDFLMVHHWTQLCALAQVKPKLVLSMSREISTSIADILTEELKKLYGGEVTMGAPTRVLQMVTRRAQRVRELYMAAPNQKIAGIKKVPVAPPRYNEWD
jgi:hypothetical protein